MKKHIIQFFASAFIAVSAFAYSEPTGTCLTWLGYNALDGAYGNYSSFFGAYSGKNCTLLDYGSYVGVMSGAYASNLKSCNAMGYYAMANAYDNSYVLALGPHAGQTSCDNCDCVFIGRNAGREAYNCTDCVFIGKNAGAGMSGNGCIDIGGKFLANEFGTFLSSESYQLRFFAGCLYLPDTGGIVFGVGGAGTTISPNSIAADNFYGIFNGAFSCENWRFIYNTQTGKTLESELTSIRTGARTSVALIDEDTGDKYVVKVKSGALKLYKVEETEE